MKRFAVAIVLLSALISSNLAIRSASTQAAGPDEARTRFLRLCDLAIVELDKPNVAFKEAYRTKEDPKTHHYPYFEDSYAIRGLAVAYDMTGDHKYFDACTRWADRIVAEQQRMTPAGAYAMNYYRKPDHAKGLWFVADSSSVAEAVLAVAVRTPNIQQRERYLDSVRSFARLVIDNYVSVGGGVTDGLWTYKGEWWASTAIFGTLMVHAHAEMGTPEYLRVAQGAVDWLNRYDFNKPQPPAFDGLGPAAVFYGFEFYAAMLPHFENSSPRREAALRQIAAAAKWLDENQKGRGAKTDWGYLDKGKTYMSGNPYWMYRVAQRLPKYHDLAAEADRELAYAGNLLFQNGGPRPTSLHQWESMTWAMMSYAEKLSPGDLFRASFQPTFAQKEERKRAELGATTRTKTNREVFFDLCDLTMAEIAKPTIPFEEFHRIHEDPATHHCPFFMASYGVRPLCVAYDMTHERKYLDACTRWADQMVAAQDRMTPKGAYFMNYGKYRQTHDDRRMWFSADSGSIATAVLAVAVRTDDPKRRQRYLGSVRSFTRLVIDNYTSQGGGVTDGLWSYKGEWWASTAIIGTLMVAAYQETKDPEYLKVVEGAVDWLNQRDFRKADPPAFDAFQPSVVFYCFEFYAAALPHLKTGSPRHERAKAQIADCLKWLAENQKGRGAQTNWNYLDLGMVYMPGNPYFMYLLARKSPQYADQAGEADHELRYITELLYRDGKPRTSDVQQWGLITFAMMSYAEKLSPGALLRASR